MGKSSSSSSSSTTQNTSYATTTIAPSGSNTVGGAAGGSVGGGLSGGTSGGTGGGANQGITQLSGITLDNGATLSVQDQGSLRAAYSLVDSAFQSIETNNAQNNAAYDQLFTAALGSVNTASGAALSAQAGAFQDSSAAQAQAYNPGGTFDTQTIFTYVLIAGVLVFAIWKLR